MITELQIRKENHFFNLDDVAPKSFNPADIKVGQGITLHSYSDANPYEIIAISKTGRQATIREMKATLNRDKSSLEFHTGGFAANVTGKQVWDIESDEDGYVRKMNWSNKKQRFVADGKNASLGAYKHYDYNF